MGNCRTSREQLVDHASVHVGQPEIATIVPIRETLMIEPQEMQDGRVKVMV